MPAFRRPESKNAAATLVWMGVLLGTLFFGISVLAHRLEPYPSHDRTVIAQLGPGRCSATGPLFVFLQFATAAILVLAANTAYNGFPSLSSIIANDGYLPRQLDEPRRPARVLERHHRAGGAPRPLLLVAFGGITNALIPLYAVGRVHVVHAVAVGDGAPPPDGCGSRAGSAASCSTRSARSPRWSCC